MARNVLTFLAAIIVCTMNTQPTAGAEPFRKVLASTKEGVRVDLWKTSSAELKLSKSGAWSISKTTLHGGKQEGVDMVVIDNGRLQIALIPTRGMSIAWVKSGDVRLGWDSPVQEIVHPQYVNLQSRGGLGWLEGFNEWMVRCGLEFAGHPGKDKFINNVGDEAEMDLTLHGKIGNIPASEVEVVVDRDPPHRLRVRGRVDERMFYGPKLELWAEASTEPGSDSFRISDTIKNHGAYDQEFQIIYHGNHGTPLLEAGAKVVGAFQKVTPFNANAAKAVASFDVYAAPQKGFVEQVYCIVPYADATGQTELLLQNPAASRGLAMKYSTTQLPYLTLWKNTSALEEGYVTGLEPGTGFPFNRRVERKNGRVPKLGPGQSRSFQLDFTVLNGAGEVSQASQRVKALQAGRPTAVEHEPMKTE